MINLIDILPGVYQAATGKTIQNIDGQSFLQTLTASKIKHREYIFGAHTNRGIMAGLPFPIRSVRDKRFKYIRNLNPDGISSNITTHNLDYKAYGGGWMTSWKKMGQSDSFWAARHKLILNRPAEELYDLQEDPWELNNLADSEQYYGLLKNLSHQLDQWMTEQNDTGMQAELSVEAHSRKKIR